MDPPEDTRAYAEIFFEAMSVWCSEDEEPGFFRVGFQLYDIDIHNLRLIGNLIEDFGLQD